MLSVSTQLQVKKILEEKRRIFLMNRQYRLPFIFRTLCLLYLGLIFSTVGFGSEDIDCLRVATYNIRREGKEELPEREWKNRLPAVVKLLEDIKPDIIGLQESTKEQIGGLADKLENHAWFGQGRGESWGGRGTNERNPIFYNTESLILHHQDTFHVNDWESSLISWLRQPHVIGVLPRICTWGLFEIKKTGHKFYVYNTHLDHKFATARFNQLKTIIGMIKKNSDTDNNNVILLGDFNTDLDGTIRSIVSEAGLRDTKELAKHSRGPRETATGWDDTDLQRIDHILIKSNNEDQVAVVKQHVVYEDKGRSAMKKPYSVITQHPSDHRPVFVDVCFPQS